MNKMIRKVAFSISALLFSVCLSAQVLVIPNVHGRTFWTTFIDLTK